MNVSAWEPMTTAPKDGSEILVCKAGSDDAVELVAWNIVLATWLDRNAEPYHGATHWLPVPPVPMN
jgi:hypothetical protein